MSAPMTGRERSDLLALARARAKVAKADVRYRETELLADLEAKLAATYWWDDGAWREVVTAADRVVAEADELIAKVCAERGIPPEFRPKLSTSFYGRGETANKDRRVELRRVGTTEIASRAARARAEIDRKAVEVQTLLVAAGLTSEAGAAFLERLPSPEALMPAVEVVELQALTAGGDR